MITAGILYDILIKYFDKRQKKDIIEKTEILFRGESMNEGFLSNKERNGDE
ncbi:MAG: hypothetical protein K2M91_14015 [Lachnospiraceae bacterium]|nr:hypothetical protein [Lachnospiraceae bacterium]